MATPEQSVRANRTLDTLYRNHAAEVYRYTYAVLGNHADAEDVTQATFVNALRALERGERPEKPANWLLVIAHNLVRQRFRQQGARPTEVELEADVPNTPRGDDADPTVDELVAALGRIPESQREAIVMREFEGRSYAEIAEILGITTSALETLLFRARRSLAEELANLVTCAKAEQDFSRLLDGRLSRKERRRLQEHIRSCPSCARFETLQRKQRRVLKGLAVLPLPFSLTFFKGAHTASATGLPTIGGTAAAGAGGSTVGSAALAGVATKAAAVVAAAAVAGGVGYTGVTHVHISHHPATKTRTHESTGSAARHASTSPRNRPETGTAGNDATHGRAALAPGKIKGSGDSAGSGVSGVTDKATPNGNGVGHGDTPAPGGRTPGNNGGGSTASANAPGHTKTTTSDPATAPGRSGTAPGQTKDADGKTVPNNGNGKAKGKTKDTIEPPAAAPATVPTGADTTTGTDPATGNAGGNANGQGNGNGNAGTKPNGTPKSGS